jgi:hypothetical protein
MPKVANGLTCVMTTLINKEINYPLLGMGW